MNASELTTLRENLGTLVDHMDDFLPAPTVEAGWVLEASGELGRQARAIARVLDMHTRLTHVPSGFVYCYSCGSGVAWPCSTVRAIEGVS